MSDHTGNRARPATAGVPRHPTRPTTAPSAPDPSTTRPAWWAPDRPPRQILLSLAATRGALPWLTATRLVSGTPAEALLQAHSPEPQALARALAALGIRFLAPGDPEWPFAEDAAPDPPCAWLFAAGRPLPRTGRAVAIVGGRRATPLRQATARTLATALATAGCPIVSGGAIGVDAAAHHGALDAGGDTIAVLGAGLDVPYPRPNADLLTRLRAGEGTLVGEHPPGAPPRRGHFLPRNRLIAALAAAVVVVEARERSGSLSTARAAGARGSGLVMAIPGPPWDPGAQGCNNLIRDGAVLVRGAADVLAELGVATPPAGAAPGAGPPAAMSVAGRRVMAALSDGVTVSSAHLLALTRLDAGTLGAAVVELELAGVVERGLAGIRAIALTDQGPSSR